ncbi:glycoside hydrolase family 3 N-terminal domain-containing protein [Flavitalea sp.]|nr:glycoside hydrolase family 3 N-terminal domain-containing protein [Flavitalea sp.]
MKKLIIAALILAVGNGYGQTNQAKMNQFISALIAKMTIEEKIGQLNLPSVGFDVTGPILSQGVEEKIKKGLVGGVFNTYTPIAVRKLQDISVKETRLKIPLIFGYDVVHGHRTIFPIPLVLSATWDTLLIEKTARAAAEEMSADGLNWTFSPMVDIARDPRWGRVSEGAGEDWWLGSKIARAMVRGYQGTDLSKDNTVLACVSYSDIKLNKTSITASSPITATITVTNSGNYDGEEVVQLYIRDLVGSVTRPVMELKGYQKIMIKKGESKQVNFQIKSEDCKFFNSDLKWVSEPGDFKVYIGPDSRDVKEASFKL